MPFYENKEELGIMHSSQVIEINLNNVGLQSKTIRFRLRIYFKTNKKTSEGQFAPRIIYFNFL